MRFPSRHPARIPGFPLSAGNGKLRRQRDEWSGPNLRKAGYIISPSTMINAIVLQFMADLNKFFNLFLHRLCGKMIRSKIQEPEFRIQEWPEGVGQGPALPLHRWAKAGRLAYPDTIREFQRPPAVKCVF
jgi:hypothetical protein